MGSLAWNWYDKAAFDAPLWLLRKQIGISRAKTEKCDCWNKSIKGAESNLKKRFERRRDVTAPQAGEQRFEYSSGKFALSRQEHRMLYKNICILI